MANQPQPSRKKFTTQQAWQQFLQEMQVEAQRRMVANIATPVQFDLLAFRIACYKDIEAVRGRPLLVYATKFVNNNLPGNISIPNSIDLGDIDGFTDLISTIPSAQRSVDVLIHSPGGKPDATERLVSLLRSRFDEVHFLIPHSAYSAATMLALSGNTITLHPSATLGPIDPQINGRPARSIKKGFEKVRDQVKANGPTSLPAYMPLLEKMSLELLEICEDSEKLSRNLVKDWLKKYMLPTEKFEGQIERTVDFFSNYDDHLIHSRPIVLDKIKEFQLEISYSQDPLSDLLWEAYILLENFFGMTAAVKTFENTSGISWSRQLHVQIPGQQLNPGQPPKPRVGLGEQ